MSPFIVIMRDSTAVVRDTELCRTDFLAGLLTLWEWRTFTINFHFICVLLFVCLGLVEPKLLDIIINVLATQLGYLNQL